MATVDKNFRIKNGLVVEGSTGTINGNTILTETTGDSYILSLIGGTTLVKSVSGNLSVDGSGDLTINISGLVSDLAGTRLYANNNQLNVDVEGIYDDLIANGVATTTDISDAIGTFGTQTTTDIGNAITTAETYTDTALESYTPTSSLDSTVGGYGYLKSADISSYATQSYADNAASTAQGNAEDYADGLASNYDATGSASAAQTAAQSYADGLASNYDPAGSASTAESNANSYTDTQITNLVDGAPDLLNTLNELSAAIGNDSNYASTLTTALGNKQDTLTAGEGIYIDGLNVITGRQQSGGGLKFVYNEAAIDRTAVDTWYDPAGAASTAESNANSYTDTAVGNIASAVSQIDGAAIAPESVTINSVAKQYATTITGAMISDGASTVMGLSASTYRTIKALVKAKNGVHTQVSEILLTLDTSNNVAITEYAMVGTNGSLGDVNAIYHASGNIFITFTPVYDNTDVMCYATALI